MRQLGSRIFVIVAVGLLCLSCVEKSREIDNSAGLQPINNALAPLDSLTNVLTSDDYLKSDSLFKYKNRAFENIYFGAHNVGRLPSVVLLNRWFRAYPNEHPYYGLHEFELRTECESLESAKECLRDLSLVIDRKYPDSRILDRYATENSSLMRLELKIVAGIEEHQIPKDDGLQYTYKRWQKESTQVDLGYKISYTYELIDSRVPKSGVKFNRHYHVYLRYKDLVLQNLIEEQYKISREKVLKQAESKF